MIRLAIYDPETGDILRVVRVPTSAAANQAQPGEAAIEVGPDIGDDTHRIVDGAPVPI